MKNIVAGIFFGLMVMSSSAFSATDTGVTLSWVGCGQDGTCFANVSPSVSQNCTNNAQVRWSGITAAGRNFTAAALTAGASGATVNLGTIDGQCSGNFPVLNFITVVN